MKVLKITAGSLLGLFLLAVLGYMVLLFINRNDRPPSEAVLRFQQIVAARPAVAPADNGAVYLLGFGVPADADPVEVGTRRAAWLESFNDKTNRKSDPLRDELHFRELSTPGLKALWEVCKSNADRSGCPAAFESAAHDWTPNEMDSLALQRYEALLIRHAWRDIVPLDVTAPLAPLADVLHAQRLYLLRVMQLAAAGKTDEVRTELGADFAHWRGAAAAADNLIVKMIAIEALRSHFFYGSVILRRMPASQIEMAMPADWLREFSAAERSMHRVMAGEVAFSANLLREPRYRTVVDVNPFDTEQSQVDKWIDLLARPLFKVQDTVNEMAERRLRICEEFAVPMQQYPKLERRSGENAAMPLSLYNPSGRFSIWKEDRFSYEQYALRTASLEGMRRAAVLTARLRARGVLAEAVPGELEHSDLRDPYTDKPFAWNATRRSVNFLAPEKMDRRVEYFY